MTSRSRIRTAMPVALLGFPDQYVSVAHDRPTIKRDGKFCSFGSLFPETIFLSLPLIQFKNIDARTGQSRHPFAIVGVAENGFNDDHGCLLAKEIFLVERDHL